VSSTVRREDGVYKISIERGKIREFARAVHAVDSAYEGPAAIVPPTFLTTAQTTWEPADESPLANLGFSPERLLHGEEEFTFHGRLPEAGEDLRVSARVADCYEKAGGRGGMMRFAVIVHEFVDGNDVLVAEQRTTVIETAPKDYER
jgi:hypothetical protein